LFYKKYTDLLKNQAMSVTDVRSQGVYFSRRVV